MWAFLKYNNILLLFIPFIVCATYSLKENRTNDVNHGLWEIREQAVDFLYYEGIKHHIFRDALEPNLKIVVPRCSIPLRAIWTPEYQGLSKYTVSVICDKTIPDSFEAQWSVAVPTIAAHSESQSVDE